MTYYRDQRTDEERRKCVRAGRTDDDRVGLIHRWLCSEDVCYCLGSTGHVDTCYPTFTVYGDQVVEFHNEMDGREGSYILVKIEDSQRQSIIDAMASPRPLNNTYE